MRFKLDECLDVRLAALFSNAGHDIQTIHQENLSGAQDDQVYSVCLQEERTLLTQDMDFSNPFRFPLFLPRVLLYSGISQLYHGLSPGCRDQGEF